MEHEKFGHRFFGGRIGTLLISVKVTSVEHPVGSMSNSDDEFVAANGVFHRRHDEAITLASLVYRQLIGAQLRDSGMINHAPIYLIAVHFDLGCVVTFECCVLNLLL